jgi:serine/threonine-protein kinase
MERLEGETLSARLRRGDRLLVPEALGIAAAVLDGLSAAHEIGVIHRDVKPPNIFLVRGGGPKLLDFGVAKVTDASGVITARGIAIGTPRYMSPEQARGESLDGRSDIYAAGLILFEMISGRGPFDDSRDANELVLAHITREAPRLSNFVTVAPELDLLVASMLEKDPRARPTNARSLAGALKNLADRYTLSPSAETPTRDAPRAAAAPDSAPPTRPDGVASRNSTPDAITRQAAISTREVTLRMSPEQIRAHAMQAQTSDPTTLHRSGSGPSPDTVIDPPTFAENTALDPTRNGERTEMLGEVESPPASDAPPTRTAVPAGDNGPNLTPPPVVPSTGARTEPVPRRLLAVVAALGAVTLLALLGFSLASSREAPPTPAAMPGPPGSAPARPASAPPPAPTTEAVALPPPPAEIRVPVAPEAALAPAVGSTAPPPPKADKEAVLAASPRLAEPGAARPARAEPKPQASQSTPRRMPGSGL